MFNFFKNAFLSIITALSALLTSQQVAQVPTPTPIVEVASQSAGQSMGVSLNIPVDVTPTSTPVPVMEATPTPDIPALIDQLSKLKDQIVNMTPEPTPTPEVVVSAPVATPVPTPTPTPVPVVNHISLTTQKVIDDRGGNSFATLKILLPEGVDQIIITDFTATISGLQSQKGIFFLNGSNNGPSFNASRTGDTTFHFSGSETSDGLIIISLGNGQALFSSITPEIDSLTLTDVSGNPIQINAQFPIVGGTVDLRH